MANLRGLRFGNSDFGLRLFWPVEMPYYDRASLNKIVETQMSQLQNRTDNCFYDKTIEDKYVLILPSLYMQNFSRLLYD